MKELLIVRQILLVSTVVNVQRTLWRIWMLGLLRVNLNWLVPVINNEDNLRCSLCKDQILLLVYFRGGSIVFVSSIAGLQPSLQVDITLFKLNCLTRQNLVWKVYHFYKFILIDSNIHEFETQSSVLVFSSFEAVCFSNSLKSITYW